MVVAAGPYRRDRVRWVRDFVAVLLASVVVAVVVYVGYVTVMVALGSIRTSTYSSIVLDAAER